MCLRLIFLLVHILYGVCVVFVYRLRAGKDWYHQESGRFIIQRWMRQACRILAIRLQVNGRVCGPTASLFVANHVSWIDTIALASLLDTKLLSKGSVKYWPVIGWLVENTGNLFITRGKNFALSQVIEQVQSRLDSGVSVLFFPEGTTTDGRQVCRFHAGLFKSITGTRHTVQAIALRYQRQGALDRLAPYIGKDNFVVHLFRIAALRETQLEVAFTEAFPVFAMSRHDIADKARKQITEVLPSAPQGNMVIPRRMVT